MRLGSNTAVSRSACGRRQDTPRRSLRLLLPSLQDRYCTCVSSITPSESSARNSIASLQVRLLERIGIDAVDLECDVCGLRMQGPNGRAVATLTWIITTALEIGAVMKREEIEAARLETERDARLAGEPGARAANYTVLLGVALRHGAGYTPRILSPRDDLAAALVEAGQRAR